MKYIVVIYHITKYFFSMPSIIIEFTKSVLRILNTIHHQRVLSAYPDNP